ncbi:MAG: pyridoxal phosphate-dependent aminotransferase, partial [Candidatus Cloacimonadaceae bacterium]|nr:pyridoxal phosphate-dependent aminotransferase [Candidatus Cloacimonadaceae bacterium]
MPSLTEALRLGSIELSLIRQIMNLAPPDAINLALGELGFPMPEFLREQAIKLLRDANPVYTPNAGLSETRTAIAEHYYPGASIDRICVTNGAEEAIFITLFALINPGDKVAIPDPDYTAYPAICQMLEAKNVRLPFREDFHSIDWDVWEQILSGGVKALILSNPSNPSGFTLDEASAQKLAEICDRHQVAIIVDEIYSK